MPPHRKVGLGGVCSDECMRTLSGVRKPGTESKSHRPPKPPDNIPVWARKAVMQRDHDRCRWCGSTAVHLHHIFYRSEGVDHSPHNLITLCEKHHSIVHSNKRYWKPILLATIWNLYLGKPVTIPQVQRSLERAAG